MDWASFTVKYQNREEWAFEQMAYLLFCAEFNNDIGLFRYKNQTGIEAEAFEKDDVLYGFSAKFYEVALKDRKNQIIENITKAKGKNPKLDVIYFYVNKELSESSKADTKKPDYQIEIEKACEDLGVKIEWRVPSHLELQLALPKNKYIYDLFFNLNPTLDKLQDNVEQHNLSILNAIRTSIMVDGQNLEIDRTDWLTNLSQKVKESQNLIISGEGGSGKTAIIKRFYQKYSDEMPICIFKATELNVNHISDLFKFDNNFSVADFFGAYESETAKLFIIDSAEKLSEIANQNVLNDLIAKLTEHNWTIIFTTRLSYLDDLRFHLKESYGLKYETLNLKQISDEELTNISHEFKIELPKNENFKDRIRNLFYLNEYVGHKNDAENIDSFADFIDLLWKKKIQNSTIHKNNVHIERGRCFLEIANKRANTGKFYIDSGGLSQEALAGLKQDDILGYDEKHDGYFITHDIYEEWALNRIIEKAYHNNISVDDFFKAIGDGLAIRRTFRYWLSSKLLESDNKEIKKFIKQVFTNVSLEQFWKDELLVFVLLSDYSDEFFKFFEAELLADEFFILKRILFLLQVACNDVGGLHYASKPKGRGWDSVIAFIDKHKDSFFKNYYKAVLPILLAWSQANHQGTTTRLSGLLALHLLKRAEFEEKLYLRDKTEESVYKIIFASCDEIQNELSEIFDMVIQNRLVEHNHPYNRFCSIIVEKSYQAGRLIQLLPKSVIKLCELFWVEKNYRQSSFSSYSIGVEQYYGLHDLHSSYFPASANQTPVWWLLNSKEFLSAIDFIISFTNEAVTKYYHSNFDLDNVIETTIIINGNNFSQFHSSTLWMMYRGIGSPVTPYLLQSIHMALEKSLLQLADNLDKQFVEKLLLKIISESKSSSLTSVVCSVVLAHPNKFANIALILFSGRDFFHADLSRWASESQVKTHSLIGYGFNQITTLLFNDERLKTCEDKHRKNHLESLCLQYQLVGVEDYSEEQNNRFIETIFDILDKHHNSFTDSESDISKSILFTRMDKRKLNPKVVVNGDRTEIHFDTELTNLQKNISDTSQLQSIEMYKYTGLEIWSCSFGDKNSETAKKYDENPLLALKELKELIEDIKHNNSDYFLLMNKTTPYKVCAKLIIEHSDKLSKDEREFCRDGVIESVERLTLDNYNYQISDGIEECTHALPKLIELFPEKIEDFLGLFLLALFNQRSISEYKRVCDYAIESIHQHNLWQNNRYVADQILNAYIKYKPLLNKALSELKSSPNYDFNRDEQTSARFEKFKELCEENSEDDVNEIELDMSQLTKHEVKDLEIVLQLLPNDTDEPNHLALMNEILPKIACNLLADKDRDNDDGNLYKTRLNIFRKVSKFLLTRKSNEEIQHLLEPFLLNLKLNEYSVSFIEKIIWSENDLKSDKNFWYVWHLLYQRIVELFSNDKIKSRVDDSIIINYLLAWTYWGQEQKSWHSLNQDSLWLYEKISIDLPNHPAVLYSIARVLYSVGSQFHEEGIDWLFNIVSESPNLELRDLESNTLFYLEVILRQYTFINREKIKKDFRLKSKIIEILNFMIERASVHGYLLRENIL